MTGSPTVGLYLLDGLAPELVYSDHVAEGLLENYKAGFWKCDPVLDCIMTRGCAADGESVIGPQQWRHSASFEMLHEWGFAYNMGGPLWSSDKIVGVLFTATTNKDAPYTSQTRQRMELLCRAGSLALTNMKAGEIEAHLSVTPVHEPAPLLSASLPPRSAEVAVRVCRGQTNKEIAREMGISDQTVKEHVANLCRRFGAHNRTELAALLLNMPGRQSVTKAEVAPRALACRPLSS
ncbi:response regulator transcription factor [Bradyrhizobium sp. HKCCYLS3077]|uniref:response regulator transcription factor n=1 Tax=Bradyrhizobium sp. HKCCYLS3077 TaxID=3420761 RepID=UPI003EBB5B53